MSNHNYSQYSKKNYQAENDTPERPIVEDTLTLNEVKMESPAIEPTVPEVPTVPETVTGVVVNCAKLNVRASADLNANVICVLDAGSYVEIDKEKSTAEWFKVQTASGVDGYCMRKFISASL